MLRAIAFPLVLAITIASERVATYLLGVFPGEPALWWAWLELRPLFRPIWFGAENLGVQPIGLHFLTILVATSLFVLLAIGRHARLWAFLGNHAALLFLASCVWVANIGHIVAIGYHPIEFETTLVLASGVSGLAVFLMCAGVMACAFCHWSYLRPTSHRARPQLVAARQGGAPEHN